MMEATFSLGTFNAADIFWYPSPDLFLETILSRSSTDNSFVLMAFFQTCTVNCVTLYRQVCAFPNLHLRHLADALIQSDLQIGAITLYPVG
ncbi:hypothetical protein J4Q44_G00073000 [Coregonus suidteri]|uniref:Uncharacterized protein n=1 Tax=Coregonus suidteri TaxID=861788 RepID=A0AAN8M6L0_9TELE